jgi:hypothetical protein
MAEHGQARRTSAIVAGSKRPAEAGTHAEQIEVAARHRADPQLFGIAFQ